MSAFQPPPRIRGASVASRCELVSFWPKGDYSITTNALTNPHIEPRIRSLPSPTLLSTSRFELHHGFRTAIREIPPPPSRPEHLHPHKLSRAKIRTASFPQEPSRCHLRTQDGAAVQVPRTSYRGRLKRVGSEHVVTIDQACRAETERGDGDQQERCVPG